MTETTKTEKEDVVQQKAFVLEDHGLVSDPEEKRVLFAALDSFR